MANRLIGRVTPGIIALIASASFAPQHAATQTSSAAEWISWLSNPESAWLASAHLQTLPEVAAPLLLESGRVRTGPHAKWTAPMIALSKLGPPAVPAIAARLASALADKNQPAIDDSGALIEVLGSIGPLAVPALVQAAESSTRSYQAFLALDHIVRLEQPTQVLGRDVNPWLLWRPADSRLEELQKQIVPLLPRVRQILERALDNGSSPGFTQPQRVAAYLLARWGTGGARARGLQVLDELALANEFSDAFDATRFLFALKAPQTRELLRLIALRVPPRSNLRDHYLQMLARARDQLGDGEHVSLPSSIAERLKTPAAIRKISTWEANQWMGDAYRWMDELAASDGPALLRMVDQYLARPDLNHAHVVSGGGGFGQPSGMSAPHVVTILLELVQRNVAGAMQRLQACLRSADPQIRAFGALALAAYDLPRAVERLAIDAKNRDRLHRQRACEFLLQLGDRRGFPAKLEALGSDYDATRQFACRNLRAYSQQPLPCDATATAADRAVHLAAWRAWWKRNERTFQVRTRQAELDLQHSLVMPLGVGTRSVK